MRTCPRPDCAWRAIAPSSEAARQQYSEHLLSAHGRPVEAEIPEGMVQIRDADGEWETMTPAEAKTRIRSDDPGR